MRSKIISSEDFGSQTDDTTSTSLQDDPDPEGYNKYGMLALDFQDQTGPAYDELENELAPGEAEKALAYMTPASDEEAAMAEDPMFKGLEYVDDDSHTDDVLKISKAIKGIDARLDDATYGDNMSQEELCDRYDTDRQITIRAPARRKPKVVVRGFDPDRDRAKVAMLNRLAKKMITEHTDWLITQDKNAGVAVRPRSYYENISRMWTVEQYKKRNLPVSTSGKCGMGGWANSMGTFIGRARVVLATTMDKRPACDSSGQPTRDTDMGWGFKSFAKKIGRGVKKGASYAKRGLMMPLTLAERAALYPIKKIVRRFSNKIVSRRANFFALKNRGVGAKPTKDEYTQAKIWAKAFVRHDHPKYGGAIASLMGAEHGVSNVDISFGTSDSMGFSGSTVMLIALGPISLAAILLSMLSHAASGGHAPPPQQGSDQEQDEQKLSDTPDDGTPPDGSAPDGSAPDGSSPDGSAPPPSAPPPEADQAGWHAVGQHGITFEQLAGLGEPHRTMAKNAISCGELRLI